MTENRVFLMLFEKSPCVIGLLKGTVRFRPLRRQAYSKHSLHDSQVLSIFPFRLLVAICSLTVNRFWSVVAIRYLYFVTKGNGMIKSHNNSGFKGKIPLKYWKKCENFTFVKI